MSFFDELKRRNVFRVAIGYVITAWLLLQAVDLVLENINAPDWVMQVFMLALAVGFPLAIFFARAIEEILSWPPLDFYCDPRVQSQYEKYDIPALDDESNCD